MVVREVENVIAYTCRNCPWGKYRSPGHGYCSVLLLHSPGCTNVALYPQTLSSIAKYINFNLDRTSGRRPSLPNRQSRPIRDADTLASQLRDPLPYPLPLQILLIRHHFLAKPLSFALRRPFVRLVGDMVAHNEVSWICLLYTSPSPRD